MFKEGNQRCGDRGNLCGRYVHEFHLLRGHDGEVGVKTCLDTVAHERAVLVKGSVALCDNLTFLDFGGEVDYFVVIEVDFRILYFAVGGFDEAEVVDLSVNAKR